MMASSKGKDQMALSTHAALAKDRRNAEGQANAMQHRHYAVIAGILKEMGTPLNGRVAVHFADKLQAANANFDRNRFLRACGLRED
jgi:hypothetical protein